MELGKYCAGSHTPKNRITINNTEYSRNGYSSQQLVSKESNLSHCCDIWWVVDS